MHDLFLSMCERRLPRGCWPFFLLGLFGLCADATLAQSFAYVANSGSNTVSVIDTQSDVVVATVTVDSEPWGVAVNPDGTQVYVTCLGSNSVVILDAATNTTVGRIPLPKVVLPSNVVFAPDGSHAYISGYASMAVIDTTSRSVTTTVQLPYGGGAGLAVTPDGTKVYVSGAAGSGQGIFVIRTADDTVISFIPLQTVGIFGVDLSPDGKRLYVSTQNGLTVVETATEVIVSALPGIYGEGVAVSPDGTRVYVSTGGEVSVVDAITNTLVATIITNINSSVGSGIQPAVTADSGRVYVTNAFRTFVSVIDTASNTLLDTLTVGLEPRGIAITKRRQSCEVAVPQKFFQTFDDQGNQVAWACDIYNHPYNWSQPPQHASCPVLPLGPYNRMAQKGCATAALAMALNAAGVFAFPVGGTATTIPFDPGSLNSFMVPGGGYYSNHNVDFEWTTQDVSFFTRGLRGAKNIYFDDTLRGDPTLTGLKNAVCGGHAVIVTVPRISNCQVQSNVAGGHYVVVTGESEDSLGKPHFNIVDPGCRAFTSLDQYGNNFTIRGFVSDPGDVSTLKVATDDGADLLLTDPTGNRTGFDSAVSMVRKDIPRSSYGQDFLTDNDTGDAGGITHSINVFQPAQGSYQITAIGLKLSTYELSIASFSSDGSPQPRFSLIGIASSGSNSSFQVQFSPTPGNGSLIARIATFQSVLTDISGSLQIGLIEGHRLADRLSDKIERAGEDAAEGRTHEAREILKGFKDEVSDRTPRNISEVAAQILLEDADSLLGQLPKRDGNDDNEKRDLHD
jgi:YVTN family beta-propeller protein